MCARVRVRVRVNFWNRQSGDAHVCGFVKVIVKTIACAAMYF